MKISFIFLSFLVGISTLIAQKKATPSLLISNEVLPVNTSAKTYYQKLLKYHGKQYRYEAAKIVLNKYPKEEYCSRMYNLLAEEAVLMQNFAQAKCYYNTVVETQFNPDYYAEGLLAEQEKIKAIVALRNIALSQKAYQKAIDYHQTYLQMLQNGWTPLIKQNKLRDDKVLAVCYQNLGKSEKAITILSPYAFGHASVRFSQIDKQAINHLTDLLYTKYPKKAFKKMRLNIINQIYVELVDGNNRFYLQILDNKIYLENDSANYGTKTMQDDTLKGEAIAHYQRKLRNSYFYQSLMQK